MSRDKLGIDLEANLVGDDIVTQTRKAIENLENTLRSAGLELKDIVKTTVYLSDMDNFELMNQTYAIYFAHPYPARTAFEVGRLPENALVEIEAIAVASSYPILKMKRKLKNVKENIVSTSNETIDTINRDRLWNTLEK
ncbi:RidA family protein [Erysipelothrix sp. D19-032]